MVFAYTRINFFSFTLGHILKKLEHPRELVLNNLFSRGATLRTTLCVFTGIVDVALLDFSTNSSTTFAACHTFSELEDVALEMWSCLSTQAFLHPVPNFSGYQRLM